VSDIPWKKVYDLVLSCGNIHSPKEFAIEIVRQAELFVPFDHAASTLSMRKGVSTTSMSSVSIPDG